jgi:hypothetical protein
VWETGRRSKGAPLPFWGKILRKQMNVKHGRKTKIIVQFIKGYEDLLLNQSELYFILF